MQFVEKKICNFRSILMSDRLFRFFKEITPIYRVIRSVSLLDEKKTLFNVGLVFLFKKWIY